MASRLPRTQVRRLPERQVSDREAMLDVLRAGRLAHVGVVDELNRPRVMPVAYAIEGTKALLLHGSTASQLFRSLAAGAPVCVTVTFLDGLVVANSSFNSSMNYRSVVVFGHGELVPEGEKLTALRTLSEHLFPGHWDHFRTLKPQELKATTVIRVPLTEMSMKARADGPDDAEDNEPTRWSGVLPVRARFDVPTPGEHVRVPMPQHVSRWAP